MKNPLGKRSQPQKHPKPIKNESAWPMRINRYLSEQGIATRRDADALVEKGLVRINGKRAVLGQKVSEQDRVEVLKKGAPTRRFSYIAFNKPAGMDTHTEARGSESILKSLPLELKKLKLFPVGRLDKASRGLIILTNDGRITDRLLNPERAHEKTYEVKTKLPLRANFKEKMSSGVNIEGYVTKPAKVTILNDHQFRITLTEGKSHQIRRMVAALFNEVSDLKRTQIMNIKLNPLAVGAGRMIEGEELATFLAALGIVE